MFWPAGLNITHSHGSVTRRRISKIQKINKIEKKKRRRMRVHKKKVVVKMKLVLFVVSFIKSYQG